MQSRVYITVGRPSVCLSECLSHPGAARRCCGFDAVSPPGDIDRLLHDGFRRSAAGAPQHGVQQQLGALPGCQLT